jgi:hypothetical protein
MGRAFLKNALHVRVAYGAEVGLADGPAVLTVQDPVLNRYLTVPTEAVFRDLQPHENLPSHWRGMRGVFHRLIESPKRLALAFSTSNNSLCRYGKLGNRVKLGFGEGKSRKSHPEPPK